MKWIKLEVELLNLRTEGDVCVSYVKILNILVFYL